jgi:hypothetical protein
VVREIDRGAVSPRDIVGRRKAEALAETLPTYELLHHGW